MRLQIVQEECCDPNYLLEIGALQIYWNKPWFYGPNWFYHPRSAGAWCAIFPFTIVIGVFVAVVAIVSTLMQYAAR